MAKNLKLNIKNAQLAEALKLNQIKKPSSNTTKKGQAEQQDEQTRVEMSSAEQTTPPAVHKEEALPQQPKKEIEPHVETRSFKDEVKSFKEEAMVERKQPKDEQKPERTFESPRFQENRQITEQQPQEQRPHRPYQERGSYEQRGPRPYQDRNASDNRGPRPHHDRPFSDNRGPRPHHDRPFSDNRGPRPQQDRPFSDNRGPRPQQDRPFSENRGPRPFEDRGPRPYQERSGSDQRGPRPYQDRGPSEQRFNRPGFDRSQSQDRSGPYNSSERGPRPYQDRSQQTSGSSYEGRPPRQPGDFRGGYQGQRPSGGQFTPGSRPPFRRDSQSVAPDVKKAFPSVKDHPTREAPQPKKTHTDEDKFPKKVATAKDTKDTKATKKTDSYKSFDARDRLGLRSGDDDVWRRKRIIKSKSQVQEEVIRPKSLKIRLPITVKDLANEMKLKASQLISKLFMQGVVITLNDLLDDETTVQLLGHEFECEISIDTAEEKRIQVTDLTIKEEIQQSPENQLHLRPPVVTFMGHVDHGKTSLIDAIRSSNRVAGEAGAITQHIGAFKCHTAIGDITILDTPGHEAFSAMRSRGADVTDIVVLVVAGDEGIKTQTLEAMNQALAANVPIVVAINKCDKPNFNPETVYRQLADQNLLPEAWGGATITVNCSAVTGTGVKELLEMLALQAEVLELQANPSFRARGSVIESEMHKGMGAVATILVQNGTLRIGDSIVFGQNYARIKTMHDEYGKELDHAGPSTPVKITGLSGLAEAGSEFVSVKDEKEAKDISEKRAEGVKHNLLHQTKRGSLENLLQQKADNFEKKTLHLIVKADVQGSLEALKTSLLKIPSKKIDINFISEGVGEVSESDIQLAAASKATIIGFHTKVESHAETLIKQLKVNIRLHDIIYHAVDDTRELMLGMLDKIPQENEIGKAEVRAVFKSSQLGNIAGCQVIEGVIKRNCIVRVLRNKEVVFKGNISSLKRVKEDVKEVSKGIECGIVLQNFSDVKEGDIIHAIEVTYLTQDLI